VVNTWFIVAQFFGALALISAFISYQIKDKRKYLVVETITSFLQAFMFIAMGIATSMDTMMSLVIVSIYSGIRAIVFWWITAVDSHKRRNIGRGFLAFMIIFALTAGIFVIATQLPTREVVILQSVTLVFALGFVVGQYLPGKHPVRITIFFYAIMLFLTQTPLNIVEGTGIERWNIMGMLIEGSKIVSVIVFYIFMLQKNILSKKLEKIKAFVNCEVNKYTSESSICDLAANGKIRMAELERLVAKMLRYELALVEREEIKNCLTSEQQTRAIMDDLKTVQDVKNIMERVLKLKMKLSENMRTPIPTMNLAKS